MSKADSGNDNNDLQKGLLNIIDELKEQPGALLPVLHNIQSLFGYVPEDTIPLIASTLNTSQEPFTLRKSVFTWLRYSTNRETTKRLHTITT